MGLSMTPSTEAITAPCPREQGVASALNDVTREFGTALGVALLGALLAAGYRAPSTAGSTGPPGAADTAREGIANALEAAPGAGHAQDLISRPAVLRRRLAAGHVGGRRRHGRTVRLHRPARTEEPAPVAADETEVTENVAAR